MTAKNAARRNALGIEPSKMSVPAMDRPSVAFAWFLETMVMEHETDSTTLVMVCQLCRAYVCEVSEDDNLRVLLNTALAHNCDGS